MRRARPLTDHLHVVHCYRMQRHHLSAVAVAPAIDAAADVLLHHLRDASRLQLQHRLENH